MKVLLSWLKEFAPFDVSTQKIVDDLAELGLSVEEINDLTASFTDVVVAEVLELKPHPNADRIQLVEVSIGDGKTQQVCCGAFNMEVGDLVPLAKVGATLQNEVTITERKIRGEVSVGMICSAPELEMGKDTGGIMVLPKNLSLGEDLTSALDLNGDTLFELEVNPNRPDAMSVMGVARDLAAKQGINFSIPEPKIKKSRAGDSAQELCQLEIQDANLCGHFTIRLLTDVGIQASPAHIANRLLACGMRPLNNIVDISNYVMLELGQPTHSFDFDKLLVGDSDTVKLIIRMAHKGEKLTTLDEVKRKLTVADGVIADASDTVISLAGVMGGASTEIADSTTRVVMEAAWWDPSTIAKTARRLGLRSEASSRFERGVDTEIAELALARIAELIQTSSEPALKTATGTVVAHGSLPKAPKIILQESEIKRQLGEDIPIKKAKQLLESIGFATQKKGKQDLLVQVPSFRPDTTTQIDLIEEVARTYGYSNIARSIPRSTTPGGLSRRQNFRREVTLALKGLGLMDSISLPFLDLEDLENTGLSTEAVTISEEMEDPSNIPLYLRPNLRTGMLKNISYNLSHQNYVVNLFEVGKIFQPNPDSELPYEKEHFAIALVNEEPKVLTAQLMGLLDYFKIDYEIQNVENADGFHPTRAARILTSDGKELGIFGQIEKRVCSAFNVADKVSYAELDFELFLESISDKSEYSAPTKYPASNFDLAFWVEANTSAEELRRLLYNTASQAISDVSAEVELFDEYTPDADTEEGRSLAFRLKIFAQDRTLTDKEMSEIRDACIKAVETLGAKPRV